MLSALSQTCLFHNLLESELTTVERFIKRDTFKPGTILINAEQPGAIVYIILKGTVKIHMIQTDGTDVIIAILGPGDIVGEMSLLDHAGRSAHVITLESTSVAWMPHAAFSHCLQSIPTISTNLVRILSGRIRVANQHIQALATLDVTGRVARQLLAFVERYGIQHPNDNIRIPIRLTQTDIAGLVGASRERVNHVMGQLKQRNILGIDQKHHITVYNIQTLMTYCP